MIRSSSYFSRLSQPPLTRHEVPHSACILAGITWIKLSLCFQLPLAPTSINFPRYCASVKLVNKLASSCLLLYIPHLKWGFTKLCFPKEVYTELKTKCFTLSTSGQNICQNYFKCLSSYPFLLIMDSSKKYSRWSHRINLVA